MRAGTRSVRPIPAPTIRSAAIDVRLLAAWAVVLLAGSALLAGYGLNHDTAWMLHVAERTLDGAAPYRDFQEVNPPLAVWILVSAAALARAAGIPGAFGAYGLVTLQIVASLALTRAVLRHASPELRPAQRGAILLAMGVATILLPGYDFTQREHQTLVLFAPLLWTLALGDRARELPLALRVLVGAAAGVGVAFKPHYCVVWLLIELVVAAARRRPGRIVRAETVAGGAVVLGYAAAVLLRAPEYLRLVRELGPLYQAWWRQPVAELLREPQSLLVTGAVALALLPRSPGFLGRAQRLLALAAALFVLAVLAQGKGFQYHWYPAVATSVLSLAAGLLQAIDERRPVWPAALLGTVVLAWWVPHVVAGLRFGHDNREVAAEIRRHAAGRTATGEDLFILSAALQRAWPAAYELGLRWPFRYPSAWLVWSLGREGCRGPSGRGMLPATDRAFRDAVYADLSAARPRILVAGAYPYPTPAYPRCTTVADYFRTEPRFATFLSRYDSVGTIQGYFVVFERRDDARAPRAGTPLPPDSP